MPKQRNRRHHHSDSERTAREAGLQLPEMRYDVPGTPRWRYPTGWVTRRFWRSESRDIRVAGFVWATILVVGFVLVVASR